MPDAPEKVLLKWDSAKYWQPWKPIELKWYTSVANNIDDTFVKNTDSLIEMQILPWKAKDISSLASYKHFATEMWKPNLVATHEWIILRGSEVIVENIEYNSKINFKGEMLEKTKIILRQTK
jgi:hypothetical protein